jgi:hypothetical protein
MGTGIGDGGVGVRSQLGNGCSHVGALGGCSINASGETLTIWYYHNGPFSSSDVQTLCANVGATFVAP